MAAARIPVRFPRVAAAFDQGARVRLCESSGSEHSAAAESADLSDLVKSFIERGDFRGVGDGGGDMVNDEKEELLDEEAEGYYSDSEAKNSLKSLFDKSGGGGDVKQKVVAAVEAALAVIDGDRSSRVFKRQLMTHLREKGFDAGLCKSKWVKSSRFPAGDYEFVDVNIKGTRYIVEPFFVGEFEIARPTARYSSLLNLFPTTFIGEVEELKKIVRLMCTAIKKSMKSVDMSRPPWRRNAHMQAKWFGSYKRTTSAKPAKAMSEVNTGGFGGVKRSLGFDTLPTKSYYCRDAFASNNGLRVSHLTAAFQGI